MRRLLAIIALVAVSPLALAATQPLVQRELSGRDNRFIEMPAGRADGGFRAVAPGRRVAFNASGITMQLKGPRLAKSADGTAALRYAFAGGAKVMPQGRDLSPTVYHWLVGERSGWLTYLRSYGALVYRDVWPGVDAVFGGDRGGLKYQFEVAAGADASVIALRVEGADEVRVNDAGALEWRIGGETVVDDAPVAFQPEGAGHAVVGAAYRVDRVGTRAWRIGFTLADYDASRPLVIDPAWTGYSGLVGGSAQDQVYALARDPSANTYACGVTRSGNLPATVGGAWQGGDDAFFVKFDAAGVAQVVAYVGGSGGDICNGIALDSAGRIYLAGGTSSTDFPAVGNDGTARLRRSKGADRDAFVMRLAATGATIEYSGFIGGSEDDQANAIAVDSANRAYVTGFSTCTASAAPGCVSAAPAFPALVGPRVTHGGDTLGTGGRDAFVARVDAVGGTLEYAGFIGGDGGAEIGHAIAVGPDFSAHVAGETDSATGLAAPGGFRTAVNSRATDAADGFVARVTPLGNALGYFTLLTGSLPAGGESGADRAFGIALATDGTVMVAGETDSANFPADDAGTRAGSGPQAGGGGGMDGFVLRLNAAGTGIESASYVGGTGHDSAEGVASDGTSLYVTGTTNPGTGFPAVPQSGLATTRLGGQDGFIARIVRATPGAFAYSGFLGTAASETMRSVAAGVTSGQAVLSVGGATTTAGTTGLTNPTTGAIAAAGEVNGLVLRIDPFGPPASLVAQSGTPQSTPILIAFPAPLAVLVRDADLQPLANVVVTFSAPASGASTSFAPSTAATTNAAGVASIAATANGLAGAYTVSAQAGAASANFSLTNEKGSQAALAVSATPPATAVGDTAALSTTGGSGTGEVSYAVTAGAGFCSVSGSTLTGTGVGTCTVTATKAGDSTYNAATASVAVAVGKASQSITFDPLADRSLADPDFVVSATTSSGLAVSFASRTPTVCAVSGSTVQLLTAGACTIRASQAGDADYNPAANVDQSFTVSLPPGTTTTITGQAGTGTASATVATPRWVFAPAGDGPLETAGFIPLQGHPKSPPVPPPADLLFPLGLFDFVAVNGAPGTAFTFTITYQASLPEGAQYWKFGPTASNPTPHWYAFPGAVIAGNTVTLTIVDGGLGDDDLVANGIIVDQGGPAVSLRASHPIPTLSEWGVLILSALLVVAVWTRNRVGRLVPPPQPVRRRVARARRRD